MMGYIRKTTAVSETGTKTRIRDMINGSGLSTHSRANLREELRQDCNQEHKRRRWQKYHDGNTPIKSRERVHIRNILRR